MTPRIETSGEKKLVGKRLTMSFAKNRTGELWRSFMPERKNITNSLTSEVISMQIYKPNHFENFNPITEFEKWAAIEVPDFDNMPDGLETFILANGLYAVFDYKGSSDDNSIFQYIFQTWLPASGYILDDRPHFEILGEKYKNQHPDSEEEIWIPIKQKSDHE
ncbi:GyrI-like domain-containing protein [Terrimonas alba]|uniref:GyrI-like domain-containing protein n=1 Tax=Terrimonas alba TaxID=3349636 RepID=UPI0035F407A4